MEKQASRPEFLQSVAVVEQQCADRDGHSQIVRKDGRPEQAIVWRWVLRVQGWSFAAFGEKGDVLCQGSKEPLKRSAILGENVKARDQRGGRLRRNHA